MPAPLRALTLSSALLLSACTDGDTAAPHTPTVPHFEGDYTLVDSGPDEPGWTTFRDSLRETIAERDTAALLAVVAPDARLSYDSDDVGPTGFRALWFTGDPPDGRDVWTTLTSALDGGSLDEDGAVVAPFVYSLWPHDEHDPFSSVAIVGDSVLVRSGPSRTSRVVARVSNLILPALAPPDEGWRLIQLPDGRNAYVEARRALSPIGYRATFWPEPDGTWQLRSFLAGD